MSIVLMFLISQSQRRRKKVTLTIFNEIFNFDFFSKNSDKFIVYGNEFLFLKLLFQMFGFNDAGHNWAKF